MPPPQQKRRTYRGMGVAEFGYARTDLRRALVDAILRGEKTAGTGLVDEHERQGEELPRVGERTVLLDYDDRPVAVIETTEVRVLPLAHVDLPFARDEGEGFESVAEWRAAHERFWARYLEERRRETGDETWSINDETPVVAERFRLVELLPPPFEPSQEIRFAVVMYGGSSLAIYINGVAQELFNLVRATAPERPHDEGPERAFLGPGELRSTERVYRKLGQILGWHDDVLRDPAPTDPVRTRFVVDILSGTSAGGVNAVYLAKALSCNQEIGQLKRLWLDEGDIGLLINDRLSIDRLRGLSLQRPPQSVLNGTRLYVRALEALTAMEGAVPSGDTTDSRYVDELDLWITATDLPGLALPMKLYDRVVWERRHKSVFHFRYRTQKAAGEERNDFWQKMNPLLAFAARCTSAFPFAFEPMAVADADDVVSTFPEYRGDEDAVRRWQRLLSEYVDEQPSYRERAFADGGYLDNKPFTWATSTINRRRADVPVDRKLIYIEPDPSHPEREYVSSAKLDPIANVRAAVTSLPRHETIREDLEDLLQRNRDTRRRQGILGIVDVAAEEDLLPIPGDRTLTTDEWAALDLREMMERYGGLAFGAYHRLKVARVIDDLAAAVTRASGFNEESDEFLAVRYLVRAWVDRTYVETRRDAEPPLTEPLRRFLERLPPEHRARRPTQNRFILEFDLSYRMRRLNFVMTRLDALLRLDRRALRMLGVDEDAPPDDEERARFVAELQAVKEQLNDVFVDLRSVGRLLASPTATPVRDLLPRGESPWLSGADLRFILEGPPTDLPIEDPAASQERARELLASSTRIETRFYELAASLEANLHEVFDASSASWGELLAAPREGLAARAIETLRHFYEQYDNYDMVILPLTPYDVGEADPVEVVRISPEDATSLIDEQRSGRHKLAGVAIHHFGAFFERAWRQNDLMWGRLDGAERILDALLPAAHPQRDALLEEAQLAILEDELGSDARGDVVALLVDELLAKRRPGDGNEEALFELLRASTGKEAKPALESALEASLSPERLREFLRDSYAVNEEPEPRKLLETVGRATRVVGQVLDGAYKSPHVAKPALWLTRLGRVVWGLVEISTPRSRWALVTRYWLQTLLVLAALFLVAGIVFGVEVAQATGFAFIGVGLAVKVALWLTEDFIHGRRRTIRLLLGLVALAVLVLAGVELGVHLGDDLGDAWDWLF